MRAVLVIAAVAAGCGGSKQAKVADPGETDCEPGRCLADVSAAVEQHRPAARQCYEDGYRREPTLQGRLIINFEIDASGAVVDASQSAQGDQIEDEQVVACIADVIKGITFQPSAKGKSTRAFHRYEFNPPKE
jgi:hypothetical protein